MLQYLPQIKNTVLVILVLIFIGIIYYTNRKKYFKQVLFSLVGKAEDMFGSGKGPEKYRYVVSIFYGKLPIVIRTFISIDEIDQWIDSAVKYLENKVKQQELLENGSKKDLVDAVVNSTENVVSKIDK